MSSWRTRATSALAAFVIVVVAGTVAANESFKRTDIRKRAEAITGGDAARGRTLFVGLGCGGCHTLRGVPQAHGLVGPPLDGIAERAMIAGMLANSPGNLDRWISSPQSVIPGNAMPDMPMTDQQARDLSAFLYTRT